jgi:flavin reductase (DIM6/NTAB) family NADH-FMN oxidoreductase RutF
MAMDRIPIDAKDWLMHGGLVREVHERLTEEGILIASLDETGRLNPMTIGWGVFGCIWGRPMFAVLVRPSRYTYRCLEHTGDYTVNVMTPDHADVVGACGTTSGRDLDKLATHGLEVLPSRHIRSGGLAAASAVFECRVVHHNDVQQPNFTEDIVTNYYPDGDFHRVYFGQVLGVSIRAGFLEDDRR